MTAYRTSRRVEFRDTDAAGIAHFSVFFNMMESAEHELLRSLGTSVITADESGTISWPRVAARCDYSGVAHFEDVLEISVRVARLGEKSATYAFLFERDGASIAEGQITAVCCRLFDKKPPQSIPIPDAVRNALAPFVS